MYTDCADNSTWSADLSSTKPPFLAVGSNSHNISIFDLAGISRQTLKGHNHNIPAIKISPDGKYIASTSIDRQVIIWDAITGKILKEMPVAEEWGWCILWIEKSKMHFLCNKDPEESKFNLDPYRNISHTAAETFRQLRNYLNNWTRTIENEHESDNDERVEDDFSGESSNSEESEGRQERRMSEGMEVMPMDFSNTPVLLGSSQDSQQTPILAQHEELKMPSSITSQQIQDKYLLIQCTKSYLHIIDPSLSSTSSKKIRIKRRLDLLLYSNANSGISQDTMTTILHSRYALMHFIEIFGLLVIGNNGGNDVQVWELNYEIDKYFFY